MESLIVKKVNETFLHIECEPSTERELSEHFCFYVPGYKFMPAYKNRVWDGKIRLYNQITSELPAGLFPQILKITRPFFRILAFPYFILTSAGVSQSAYLTSAYQAFNSDVASGNRIQKSISIFLEMIRIKNSQAHC